MSCIGPGPAERRAIREKIATLEDFAAFNPAWESDEEESENEDE